MRDYWEQRAHLNPAFYVDTSLDYDNPDMASFLATGQKIVEVALDQGPVQPGGHGLAVEIGCGLGRICLALAGRFDRVVGFDISPEMVRRGRELISDPRVELRESDGSSLAGIEDASADLVLSFTVFQHIPSVPVIAGYIEEAGRVLAPGGVLAFQWNNQAGERTWPLRRTLRAAGQRLGRGDAYGRDAAAFLGSRVSLATIDAALARGGLTRVGLTNPGQLFAWCWARRDGSPGTRPTGV
jgi:SAM-dependent methyltransferase